MSQAVEEHTEVRVVTDDAAEERWEVPVDLRYDPDTAPTNVCISLPESPGAPPHDWTFSRDLLERGLRGPVNGGDVRVWPSGRVRAVVELRSERHVAVVQFDSAALTRFLRRTYAATEPVHQ
ncbi:SsgA family sporulation/cell division regulator [Streptomyces sp. TS71-3]|uniref:SsgA family sporulation/cell division regulator n=1 Tax=Streptomyces sp. TS71-3 TaxID=2733862 RepID=UPI001B2CF909|nr:SsgA family sporulation/cell division regulator [Streptomyces sp. TS71-3]GHJ39676.1 cell division protein [Streptomyces sp. TS71-3]